MNERDQQPPAPSSTPERGPMTTERPHACFDSADEQLGKKNTKLEFAFVLPSMDERLVIGTVKADTQIRGKAIKVFANFCPFCGRYLP